MTLCQMPVILRYANVSGAICERFLGFHDVSADRGTESLSEVLMKVIQKYNPEAKLICQTYDAASCMSRQRGGVRTRVKVQCPHALFVHCYAHRLNLVLAQGTKSIKDAKMFFCHTGLFPQFFFLDHLKEPLY